ncbi:helix-turn-helix transcriptional regulator [Microbacterium halophytorum]|uniref:helix-turn-helix transcriptional regulator n=1 Tax=Microbacterium halophytorum TaxID=2067568 RepID=UPI000CFB5965|nr:hypothetical protein [Microbacterium halophytorum]
MSAPQALVTPIRPGTTSTNGRREWLSPAEVCNIVPGMTIRHLAYLRTERRGPRFFKPTHKTVLYDRADIDAWIDTGAVTTRDAS